MIHWNGGKLCAIDVEVTHVNPDFGHLWQIAILPLTENIEVDKKHMPFYVSMHPQDPSLVDVRSMPHARRYIEGMKYAVEPDAAIDLLSTWVEKLDLPYNTSGHNQVKLIPLGHDYQHDKAFIVKWLGFEQYEEWFSPLYRDTMMAGTYMDDCLGHSNDGWFHGRYTFSHMSSKYHAKNQMYNDALQVCVATAKVYKGLCQHKMIP